MNAAKTLTTATVYTETVVYSPPEQYAAEAPYQIAILNLPEGGRVHGKDSGERVVIGDTVEFVESQTACPVTASVSTDVPLRRRPAIRSTLEMRHKHLAAARFRSFPSGRVCATMRWCGTILKCEYLLFLSFTLALVALPGFAARSPSPSSTARWKRSTPAPDHRGQDRRRRRTHISLPRSNRRPRRQSDGRRRQGDPSWFE